MYLICGGWQHATPGAVPKRLGTDNAIYLVPVVVAALLDTATEAEIKWNIEQFAMQGVVVHIGDRDLEMICESLLAGEDHEKG